MDGAHQRLIIEPEGIQVEADILLRATSVVVL